MVANANTICQKSFNGFFINVKYFFTSLYMVALSNRNHASAETSLGSRDKWYLLGKTEAKACVNIILTPAYPIWAGLGRNPTLRSVLSATENVCFIMHYYLCPIKPRGRDSVVGKANRYWLDGPMIESRWRRDFLHPSRPARRPTKLPI